MNILAIGAHPDDIEFCCAGTLAKYRKLGHKIFIALTTSGNQGSSIIKTREEVGARAKRKPWSRPNCWTPRSASSAMTTSC